MDPQILQLIQQYLGQMGQQNPNIPNASRPATAIPYLQGFETYLNAQGQEIPRKPASPNYPPGFNSPLTQSASPWATQYTYDWEKLARDQEQNQLMANLPRTRAERPKHNSK